MSTEIWTTTTGRKHVLDDDGTCWCEPEQQFDVEGGYWFHHDPDLPNAILRDTALHTSRDWDDS